MGTPQGTLCSWASHPSVCVLGWAAALLSGGEVGAVTKTSPSPSSPLPWGSTAVLPAQCQPCGHSLLHAGRASSTLQIDLFLKLTGLP